jgi:starvation-inducible DNA-binding protein
MYKKILILLVSMSHNFLDAESKFADTDVENDIQGEQIMINIGIDEKVRKEHSALLNQLLANEYVLYTKTLNYHWNVKGKWFGPLHELFKKQYEQLFDMIDVVAEQVQVLGGVSAGSMTEFLKQATLTEHSGPVAADSEMIKVLMGGHEHVIRQIRSMLEQLQSSNNYALENILQDILGKHEKTTWMLRAHLS